MSIKCFMLEPLSEGGAGISLFRRSDTGESIELRNAPPGAMWYATWYKVEGSNPAQYWFSWDNQNTPPLIVQTPGGAWNIDSRASNCTMKEDRLHRCWVRHGEPPNITVDKNGLTCAVGAGSIQCGNYHGFLRNGELTDG